MAEKRLMDMLKETETNKTEKADTLSNSKEERETSTKGLSSEISKKEDKEEKTLVEDQSANKAEEDTSAKSDGIPKYAERHFERSNNTIPDFLESAEKIPVYMREFVAQHRRRMSSHSKLSEDDLLYAYGESVDTFKTANGNLTMLKMRIEANNAPIYVPMNHAGANYRYLEDLVGQRLKVAIDQFVQTNEAEVDAEYILLGSLQQAEFVIGGTQYSEYLKDPQAYRKEVREGVITQIIERPERMIVEDGERKLIPNRSMVFIDYRGMTIGMREQDFYYRSLITPLHKRAFIGQKVKFMVTRIRKGDYRDSPTAQEDAKNGMNVPRGIRYFFDTTRLPLVPNPSDIVRKKLNHHTIFIAHIVRVDSVKGILVEVAPKYWIKGVLPANSPVQPTALDATAHTPVAVRLTGIDFKTKSGTCQIMRFPKGVARPGIASFI